MESESWAGGYYTSSHNEVTYETCRFSKKITSVGRHQALEFFKPIQHDVDLHRCHSLLSCLNRKDFSISCLLSPSPVINSDGGLLGRNDSLAGLAAGIKRNLQPRHIEVSIYGNLTAVATHYVVGGVRYQMDC